MDDFPAKVSSKGQVTVPKAIRESLSITDREVVFRLDGDRVIFALSDAGLDPPETAPARSAAATPRLPWDAARRTRLQQRGKVRRHPRAAGTPEPTIVVDLRAPAMRSGSRDARTP